MSLDDAPPPGLLSEDARACRPTLDPEQVAAQSGWVRAVARNLVRDPWGAEDVAQEALLAALASPPRDVPDDTHLRAWLGRVAFNLSRLDLRSGGRRRARERVVARREALPSPVEELEAAAARGELVRALRALDEPGRQVLQLRYFDGLSTAEIAVRLGVSELAVRKRLWRAREKLREGLESRTRRLQGWLGLVLAGLRRVTRLEFAGLAAAGATAWLALDHLALRDESRPEPSLARLERTVARGESAGAAGAPGEASRPVDGAGHRAHLPVLPLRPPRPEDESSEPQTPRSEPSAAGLVLDLEGAPRPGLEVVARSAPERALAWSDALGGFAFVPVDDLELEARGEGFATVVAGRLQPGAAEALVLVAPAEPFQLWLQAADGAPLQGAAVELVAREAAFARLTRPVQLPSPVLARHAPDAAGSLALPELVRAEGLILRISCPGFETLECATLALGGSRVFELRPEDRGPELAGTVSLADGRPAVGARVKLALAETRTDARGAFRLPLRGVGRGSALEVRGHGFAPVVERDVVQGLERGLLRDGVAIVLDRPLDPVRGTLSGSEPSFAGWRVLAFAEGEATEPLEARCDANGAFELELPRGSAELYAIAPDRLESHGGRLHDTRAGTFELALKPQRACAESLALRADDGRPLAGAEVELALQLAPDRRVVWGKLASDRAGTLRYRRAAGAEVELAVRHAVLGPGPVAIAPAPELALPRARALRVAGLTAETRAFRLLDAEGCPLVAEGPLGPAEAFALEGGQGAMTFVPPSARWLELLGDGSARRVALELQPGECGTLVP